MGNERYYGFSHERQNWKNSHRKYSKISKYKIEKILDCFIRDLTITEAFDELSSSRKKEPISKKTIGRKYKEMRALFVEGSFTYLELFGGAGAAALVGKPPPELMKKIDSDRYVIDKNIGDPKVRIRPYKKLRWYDGTPFQGFWLERALREYAAINLSVNQIWVVADFALAKMLERKRPEEVQNFLKLGYDFVAETNWSSGDHDFGMREEELWSKIYATRINSKSACSNRMFRDMKWLINRHPLGTRIERKTRVDFKPSSSEVNSAIIEWFPDGYKRISDEEV